MEPVTWWTVAYMVFAAAVGAAAKHVASGKPPLIDPGNKRPILDMIRDAVREQLGGKPSAPVVPVAPVPDTPTPAPVPALPAADHPLIDFLLQIARAWFEQQRQQPPPEAIAGKVPPAA